MLAYVGTGLAGLSLLLNIVGLAIPDWLVAPGFKYGLWKICKLGICVSIPSEILDATWQSTRALEILGTLAIATALGCAILKLFVMKEHRLLPKLSGASAIAAAVCMILGAVIFAAKTDFPGFSLNAGFALCIVAGVLAIVTAILILLGFKEA